VITWLVPITDAEAQYVHLRGWNALETAFQTEDPDLTDMTRKPVTAATIPTQP
jgi:hypothetical protein